MIYECCWILTVPLGGGGVKRRGINSTDTGSPVKGKQLLIYMCTVYIWVPAGGIRFPGTSVTVSCELSRSCWELSLALLQGQWVLLILSIVLAPGEMLSACTWELPILCWVNQFFFFASQPHVVARRKANKWQWDMPTLLSRITTILRVFVFFFLRHRKKYGTMSQNQQKDPQKATGVHQI